MKTITQNTVNNLVSDLREFVYATGYRDVVFGLSGGMDSALVLGLACRALGPQHVHTIMMRTKFTSQLSIDLANQISKNFGNHHIDIDIQPRIDAKLANLPFVSQNHLTLENMQSRDRADLCMTYSSEYKYLLLACGNKSEIAMGYCTLYGDTCGAVVPLGDLYKTQVYQMAEFFPEIPRQIITRPASAELAPNQVDTDNMPPYHILDNVLINIEHGTPERIADKKMLADIRRRCDAVAFKRRQMPPILKIR